MEHGIWWQWASNYWIGKFIVKSQVNTKLIIDLSEKYANKLITVLANKNSWNGWRSGKKKKSKMTEKKVTDVKLVGNDKKKINLVGNR